MAALAHGQPSVPPQRRQYVLVVAACLAAAAVVVSMILAATGFVRTSQLAQATNELAHKNAATLKQVEHGRRLTITANARTQLEECTRNNQQDRLLANLLGFSAASRVRQGRPLDAQEKSYLAFLLHQLRPIECDQQDVVRDAERRYGPLVPSKTPDQPHQHRPHPGRF